MTNNQPPSTEASEHWSRERIKRIVLDAIVAEKRGEGMATASGIAADQILALLPSLSPSPALDGGEVERLRELSERATAGTWRKSSQYMCGDYAISTDKRLIARISMLADDDRHAADTALIVAAVNYVRAFLSSSREAPDSDVGQNPCAKIFEHKYLDPYCVEHGCSSLILRQVVQRLKTLLLMARTSGGTVGPDAALMEACAAAEGWLEIHKELLSSIREEKV